MEVSGHQIRSRQPGAAFAIALVACTLARGQTNNPVTITSVRELSKQAMAYERAGDSAAAIRTYERIIGLDATKRSVLSHRLVKLQAKQGKPEAALKWARDIMKTHPDPRAYLAGVLTLVGRHDEAEKIVRGEIAKATTPHRKMVLHWQLADAYRQQGRDADARAALQSAVAAVKGLPEEKHAARHLKRFADKRP